MGDAGSLHLQHCGMIMVRSLLADLAASLTPAAMCASLSWPGRGEECRILFSNPASAARVSCNEGGIWAVRKALHVGPAACSCLVVLPDKSVGCLFERGAKGAFEGISPARFPLSWLEEGNE